MVSPFLKQAWVVSGVLTNILSLGMVLAYPTSLLQGLRAEDSPIHVDLDSASLLVSCMGMSAVIGFMGCSFLMEVYGRKWAHVICLLPSFVGWLLISYATNHSMLLMGRLLGGVTAGGAVTLGAVIIGEYSSPRNRGLFLNMKTIATYLGSMVVHILGNYFSWRAVALMSLAPLVIALINTLTWHESSSWLISKNRFEECERSFFFLRGRNEESVKEIVAMIKAQKKRNELYEEKRSWVQIATHVLKKFGRRDFNMPQLIILFGFLLVEVSGRHVFPAYALEFIAGINNDRSQTYLYTICMDLIIIATVSFSCFMVKAMRRRSLLFFSGITSLVTLLSVSLYLYLTSRGIVADDKPWIPTSLLVLYLILSNLGCTSIPLMLLGEIFPLPHRGAGSCVAGYIMSVALVVTLQTTPILMATIEVYGTFAVFALLMSLSLLVLYFILPETKNKTLQEIEDYFNRAKFVGGKTEVDADESKMAILRVES